jgi:hypothetical protein
VQRKNRITRSQNKAFLQKWLEYCETYNATRHQAIATETHEQDNKRRENLNTNWLEHGETYNAMRHQVHANRKHQKNKKQGKNLHINIGLKIATPKMLQGMWHTPPKYQLKHLTQQNTHETCHIICQHIHKLKLSAAQAPNITNIYCSSKTNKQTNNINDQSAWSVIALSLLVC